MPRSFLELQLLHSLSDESADQLILVTEDAIAVTATELCFLPRLNNFMYANDALVNFKLHDSKGRIT